jgi:hypothetical protein
MGFQPYDNKMFNYGIKENITYLYLTMLKIENLEHMYKKHQVGYFPSTHEQLMKASGLTKSQVETNLKKLIANDIIKVLKKGKMINNTPTIYCLTEIVNRTVRKTVSKTNKSDRKKLEKLKHINALSEVDKMKVRQANKTVDKTVSKTLIKDYVKRLSKRPLLKDKGIEKELHKVLSFQQELELVGNGNKFKKDECYFDDSEDIYK